MTSFATSFWLDGLGEHVNGSTARPRTWTRHLAVAAAYAACYELARHVSFSHWILTAGLRLACLLLVPTRYWPALALGEGLPVAESALLCASRFGIAWTVSAAVPMIVLCMACVLPVRRRWDLYGADGRLQMGLVLGTTLGCAVITAATTALTLVTALLDSPDAWPGISVGEYFWAYLLGAYLGALTLTPTILALRERTELHGRVIWPLVWQSRLFRDTACLALPALAGLAWFALATNDDMTRQLARAAMLLPILILAWRHGWHGTAIGGMGASIAQAVTSTTLLDPAMIHSQVVLALVISGTLMVGARASRHAARAIPMVASDQ